MGLYKLCKHKGAARNKCGDAWWGAFQYKGTLYRASLARWADEGVKTKGAAEAVFDRMKDVIRAGKFRDQEQRADLTFSAFADLYVERYVKVRGLRSRGHIELRLAILKERWSGRTLASIGTGEIEDLIQDLQAKKRKVATINRYLALLRNMFNWAVGREYVDRTPFRRGTQALIKFGRENNRQVRRVTPDAEQTLLEYANPLVKMLIVAALDTGMRRGELLKLTFGEIDLDGGLIRVRPENAKSGKARLVPIATTRLRTLLEWLRIDADGKRKGPDVPVFSRADDEALKSFRTAWERTRKRAKLESVRFHDFRSEYASRLVERNVPLSQVRDLLGHSSIVVTERYDRQTAATLKQAAGKLDTGESFQILSSSENPTNPVESVSSTH